MTEEIIRIETADEQEKLPEEEGMEIPLDRINPDTLRNMLAEFVTREWADEESHPGREDRTGPAPAAGA